MQIFVLTATRQRMLKDELLRYVMLYKYYMPKSCLEKASSKMVVVFVWMLIFTIATGFYALYLPDLYHRNIVCFWVLVTIFTVAFLLLIISYARVTCTSPGQPSTELTIAYERQGKLEELISYTEKRKIIQKERQKKQFRHDRLDNIEIEEEIQAMKRDQYCKKCRIARPARSHHCSVCEKCVLRMDHHCPWTGNCIGRDNHKYFILFLGYASFGLAIVAFSVLIDWIAKNKIAGESENDLKIYGLPLIGIASILLFLSIGFLFFAQLVGAISNITTLQSFLDSIEYHAPFDNGPQKNMEEIFGKQGWAFLPTRPKFDVITEIY